MSFFNIVSKELCIRTISTTFNGLLRLKPFTKYKRTYVSVSSRDTKLLYNSQYNYRRIPDETGYVRLTSHDVFLLERFKELNGNLIIPSYYRIPVSQDWPSEYHGFKLGPHAIRLRYRIRKHAMHKEDINLLKEMNFPDNLYNVRAEMLIECFQFYHQQYGHLKIPSDYIMGSDIDNLPSQFVGTKLGLYVMTLRDRNYFPRYRQQFIDMGLNLTPINKRFKYQEVYQAVQFYKSTYHIELQSNETFRIPKEFIVPINSEWPDYLWNMKLGQHCHVIYKFGYKRKYFELFKKVGLHMLLGKENGDVIRGRGRPRKVVIDTTNTSDKIKNNTTTTNNNNNSSSSSSSIRSSNNNDDYDISDIMENRINDIPTHTTTIIDVNNDQEIHDTSYSIIDSSINMNIPTNNHINHVQSNTSNNSSNSNSTTDIKKKIKQSKSKSSKNNAANDSTCIENEKIITEEISNIENITPKKRIKKEKSAIKNLLMTTHAMTHSRRLL